MKNFISNILVCNDAAERGIKLVSEYADVLTISSKGRKELLQVVEKHRKEYPDVNKSTLKQWYISNDFKNQRTSTTTSYP